MELSLNENIKILERRCYKVVKHNDIIQKTKFKMSAIEQKTVAFLISLIKPKEFYSDGKQPLEYEFDIKDYCKICGIDYEGGKNYRTVRETLKSLRDRSINVTLPDGADTSISWINKYWTHKGTGRAKIRFDDDMAPYLFELRENTTRYELLNILPMKSKYSIRLYEICRSWEGIHRKQYDLQELRKMLGLENELVRYPDFRRKVIEVAKKEINEYTDLDVDFDTLKKGKKVVAIVFYIKRKDQKDQLNTYLSNW